MLSLAIVLAGIEAFWSTMPFEKKKDAKKQRAGAAGNASRWRSGVLADRLERARAR
jgi:hypothetical protein